MTIALVTGENDLRLERQTRALSIAFIPKPSNVQDIQSVIDDYLALAAEREKRRVSHEDADFDPPIAEGSMIL